MGSQKRKRGTQGARQKARVRPADGWLRLMYEATFVVICLIMVITPTWFSLKTYEQFELPKICMFWFLAAFVVAFWSIGRLSPDHTPARLHLLGLCFLLYAVWHLVATYYSLNPIASLQGSYRNFQGVFTLLLVPFVAWIAGQCVRGYSRVLCVAYMVVLGGTIASLYATLQQLGIDPINWARGNQVTSTLGNRNHVGAYLCMCIPVGLGVLLAERQLIARISVGVATAWMIVSLIYTVTRGAWLGLAGALVVMLVIHRKRVASLLRDFVKMKAFAPALIITIAAVALLASLSLTTYTKATVGAKFRTLFSVKTESAASRMYFWEACRNALKDRPLVGTGPSTFYWAYLLYHPEGVEPPAINAINIVPDSPHNIHLENFCNAGVVGGLLFYGCILGVFFVSTGRILCRAQEMRVRDLFVGLCGSMVAFLVDGLFQPDIIAMRVLSWMLIGLVAGYAFDLQYLSDGTAARSANAQQRPRMNASRRIGAVDVCIIGGALVLGVVLFRVANTRLRADYYFREGEGYKAGDDLITAAAKIEQARAKMPKEREYLKELTDVYFELSKNGADMRRWTQARRLGEELAGYVPFDGYVLSTLAKVYLSNQGEDRQMWIDKAVDTLKQAVKWAPNVPIFRYNLALALARRQTKESLEESVRTFEEVLRMRPDMQEAKQNLEMVRATLAAANR